MREAHGHEVDDAEPRCGVVGRRPLVAPAGIAGPSGQTAQLASQLVTVGLGGYTEVVECLDDGVLGMLRQAAQLGAGAAPDEAPQPRIVRRQPPPRPVEAPAAPGHRPRGWTLVDEGGAQGGDHRVHGGNEIGAEQLVAALRRGSRRWRRCRSARWVLQQLTQEGRDLVVTEVRVACQHRGPQVGVGDATGVVGGAQPPCVRKAASAEPALCLSRRFVEAQLHQPVERVDGDEGV